MTRVQRALRWLGFWRLQAFRRWVGGRWVLHCPYPVHLGQQCILRWVHDPEEPFLSADLVAVEEWRLPRASITSARLAGAAVGGHDAQATEETRLRV